MRKRLTLAVLCLIFAASTAPTRTVKAEVGMLESGDSSACVAARAEATIAFGLLMICNTNCDTQRERYLQAVDKEIAACTGGL